MKRELVFLLIEDDDIHAHLITRSLESSPLKARVFRAQNGDDALAFLRQQEPFTNCPRPDVVLLDLKLPKMDGHEVLAAIKSDHELRIIPVVVMTTSSDEADRAKAYTHYANSYIVKPADFQKFREVVMDIRHYWGERNEPPCLANV